MKFHEVPGYDSGIRLRRLSWPEFVNRHVTYCRQSPVLTDLSYASIFDILEGDDWIALDKPKVRRWMWALKYGDHDHWMLSNEFRSEKEAETIWGPGAGWNKELQYKKMLWSEEVFDE